MNIIMYGHSFVEGPPRGWGLNANGRRARHVAGWRGNYQRHDTAALGRHRQAFVRRHGQARGGGVAAGPAPGRPLPSVEPGQALPGVSLTAATDRGGIPCVYLAGCQPDGRNSQGNKGLRLHDSLPRGRPIWQAVRLSDPAGAPVPRGGRAEVGVERGTTSPPKRLPPSGRRLPGLTGGRCPSTPVLPAKVAGCRIATNPGVGRRTAPSAGATRRWVPVRPRQGGSGTLD
jgi:hypothetical protein